MCIFTDIVLNFFSPQQLQIFQLLYCFHHDLNLEKKNYVNSSHFVGSVVLLCILYIVCANFWKIECKIVFVMNVLYYECVTF